MEDEIIETSNETVAPAPRISRIEKGEVVGGGYFVGCRQNSGRLNWSRMPFEWPSFETALAEAFRLADKHKGKCFLVLSAGGVVQINN